MRRIILLVLVASCGDNGGGSSSTGSCNSTTPQPFCEEYTKASTDELALDAEPLCADHHGVWADAACSRTNVIGGCTADISGPYGGFTLTDWFYQGGTIVTTADVMAKCTALGEQFVAP